MPQASKNDSSSDMPYGCGKNTRWSWVAPMAQEDKAFFAHFRAVCGRYNISPSKATRIEYEFVMRVAESEFYLQRANA